MKTYLIHIIRHGMTSANLQGRYIGHTDVELSLEGENQLRELKKEYVYPPVQAVFSSPLKRCTATAEIIYPEQNPILLRELMECSFGEFEGCTAKELEKNELFSRWLSGDPDAAPPFGESNAEFAHRVCACFEKIVEGVMKTGTKETAVVTHGGVIMALLSAYGLPEMPMHEWMSDPGCGFTLRVTPSIWMRGNKVEVISRLPYLPAEDGDEYYDEEEEFYAFDVEGEE